MRGVAPYAGLRVDLHDALEVQQYHLFVFVARIHEDNFDAVHGFAVGGAVEKGDELSGVSLQIVEVALSSQCDTSERREVYSP